MDHPKNVLKLQDEGADISIDKVSPMTSQFSRVAGSKGSYGESIGGLSIFKKVRMNSRGSNASTVKTEFHLLPPGTERKSVFIQRTTHHHEFVEARASQHPGITIGHEAPSSLRPQAISFASSVQSYLQTDYGELEADEYLDELVLKKDFTFEQLHEIFHHTLTTLENSSEEGVNMDPIISMFLKLWDGIRKSHQNLIRLQHKDHEISVELSVIMAKTQTLVKLAEEDHQLAGRLRSKLESAWGLADIGEAEEKKNCIQIKELSDEIFLLNKAITDAAKTEGQTTLSELSRLRKQFELQKNSVASELSRHHSELKLIFEKRQGVREMKTALEEKFNLLTEEEIIYTEAISRETTRKEALLNAIATTVARTEDKLTELDDLVQNLNDAGRRLADVERFSEEQQVVNQEAQHELDIATNKYAMLKIDFETQARLCNQLATDMFKRQAELKEKEEEVALGRNMISRMNRQKQANQEKVEEYKLIIGELEKEKENLKEKVFVLEKELEKAQNKLDENKKEVDLLDRERIMLNRSLEKATTVVNAQENTLLGHEIALKSLETDVAGYEHEIEEQQAVVTQLERERDSYSHEAMKLAHEVAVRLEEARKLDRTIYEYQKKLGRIETQLKKQQQIYEGAQYDKALTQRQLHDSMSSGVDNSIKLMHLAHKIMGLKFNLQEKDTIIQIESARYERVLRETSFYGAEGKRLKNMSIDMNHMAEALMAEKFVLKKTIAAVESEMGRQVYYVTAAESRQQSFERRMMAKEQELKEISEKWRVLHSQIRIGGWHFRNLVWEIRRIRVQIFVGRKENLMKSFGKKRVARLKHEISVIENIISKETFMCNSLRESMRHPINVHRWRVLECTKPESYDMVLKAHLLTKRLVQRNFIIQKQADDLNYKQQLYCQIRDVLKKAPTCEMPENVLYYEHLVEAKRQQFRGLKHELKAAILHAKYFEEELEGLQQSQTKMVRQYLRKMRSEGRSYITDYPNEDEEDVTKTKIAQISSMSMTTLGKELESMKTLPFTGLAT